MRYLLLIGGEEDNLPEPERTTRHLEWAAYHRELVASNQHRGGERLRPSSSATTLRRPGGQRLLSDGPFAETKEQLGGFYTVETSDLDEAIEWANKMPHLADGGAVEVRPIWEPE